MRKLSQSDWNIYVCQNIVANVSKRLKPLFLDPYYNIMNAITPQSFLLFILSRQSRVSVT